MIDFTLNELIEIKHTMLNKLETNKYLNDKDKRQIERIIEKIQIEIDKY